MCQPMLALGSACDEFKTGQTHSVIVASAFRVFLCFRGNPADPGLWQAIEELLEVRCF